MIKELSNLKEFDKNKLKIEQIGDVLINGIHNVSWDDDNILDGKVILNECIKINKQFRIKNEGYNKIEIMVSNLFEYPKGLDLIYLNTIKKAAHALLNMNYSMGMLRDKKKRIVVYTIKFRKEYFYFIRLEFTKSGTKRKNRYLMDECFDYFFNSESNGIKNKLLRIRSGIDIKTRKRIFQRDNYTCFYCGWKNGVNGINDRILNVDHIVPEAFGGTNKEDNLITSCFNCNISKQDKFLKFLVKDWIYEPKNNLKDFKLDLTYKERG